ncbi:MULTISPECIES: hypothetical protein [Pontibacter]|uniref:Uncharacterized protein n=1 Tax=Pontibacter lucknowensis TaxID=1077936 RepID=A0A1N7B3W7_9BACT|nr:MULTISPECIES: hypothetical protein [Pontibacter]EJF08220.1 hypothetical protein O71_22104 [Pontibacter sp. BAB1700]SIR46014.1 hypothetical protein SAMN05421545_3771 [Pontibacter lucknowensis]
MNQQQDQLEALHEIRNIMDRSSRFISLSGLSGVFAGLSALAGAAVVKWYLTQHNINYVSDLAGNFSRDNILFLLAVAVAVLILAFGTATYFTARNARKKNQRTWDNQSKRLLVNLAIPLAAGGVFCAVLLYHGILYLVAPAMLVFYGLALLNGSKYTLGDIRYLGIIEIIIGLVACVFVSYGLMLWTLGFGILHIVYGALVYFKYER